MLYDRMEHQAALFPAFLSERPAHVEGIALVGTVLRRFAVDILAAWFIAVHVGSAEADPIP